MTYNDAYADDNPYEDTEAVEPTPASPVRQEPEHVPEESLYELGGEEQNDVYNQPEDQGSLTAVALYDYQAADEDELTFDPDDIITDIEMSNCLSLSSLLKQN
nr:hypothetical protein BaRGS_004189 [Batillaria attramentaria]